MTTTPASERNDSQRMSKLEGAYEQVNERLGEMNSRIDGTNVRIDQLRTDIDTRFDVVNTRIDGTNVRIDQLRTDMDARIDSLGAQMNARFNSILVLMLGSWVTTIGVIVGLSFR